MADESTKPHRLAWILLVSGLILFAASVFYVVKLILEGWSLTGVVNVVWTFFFGLFWVLLYRRGTRSAMPSEGSQLGSG